MGRLHDQKKRVRQAVAPTLFLAFGLYLAFHTVNGERGFVAWMRINQQIETEIGKLTALRTERLTLENNVRRLRPDSLDIDLLEERARIVLNVGDPDDRVLVKNGALVARGSTLETGDKPSLD